MAWHMGKVLLYFWMELFTKGAGDKINSMEKEYNKHLKVHIQVVLWMVIRKVKGGMFGMMDHNMMENGNWTRCLGKGLINGKMGKYIQEIGRMVQFMEKEFSNGLTKIDTRENSLLTSDMDMEHSIGLMVDHGQALGMVESSMAKEYIKWKKERRLGNGKMAKQ